MIHTYKNFLYEAKTIDFVEKAKKVHGDKYNYSDVDYKTAHTKIKIICKEHGEFIQSPNSHLAGAGCPKCKGKNRTTEDFIDKSNKIHGNKYDYSKVNYIDTKTKVIIGCPLHGDFKQTPTHHMSRKQGCPKCKGSKISDKHRFTNDEFIERVKKNHKNMYDYSLVNYQGSDNMITIICPKHGQFSQIARYHLEGCGCPKCAGRNMTFQEFIENAKKIHNNKYDYSNIPHTINYYKFDDKFSIICPIHGIFIQKMCKYINGKYQSFEYKRFYSKSQ